MSAPTGPAGIQCTAGAVPIRNEKGKSKGENNTPCPSLNYVCSKKLELPLN